MLVILFIAILSSLIWLNITISDFINAKISPYYTGVIKIDERNKSKIKNTLLIIMALCWAIVLRF